MSPIPDKTPTELHRALRQLSALMDLTGYQAFVARKTHHGTKPGPQAWTYTEGYATQHATCEPREAIRLFTEAGANSDVEALFHVAVSLHLL